MSREYVKFYASDAIWWIEAARSASILSKDCLKGVGPHSPDDAPICAVSQPRPLSDLPMAEMAVPRLPLREISPLIVRLLAPPVPGRRDRLRQPTTAEARLHEGKAASSSPAAERLGILPVNGPATINSPAVRVSLAVRVAETENRSRQIGNPGMSVDIANRVIPLYC
jgi:hypothetical protein